MDLHVIGAGPAGSISAITAIRKKNADVLISEEHPEAGVPVHCSGLFSIEGLESLSEFIDYRKVVLNPMSGAVIDFAGERLFVKAKKNVAYVCDRAKFDGILAENAEREGAKIRYGECINGKFLAKNIIGADGPNSFVAAHFGFPRITKFVSTLQANVRYEAENVHSVEIFLSKSKFPGFFGWVIPHDEENAEFGCGAIIPDNAGKSFAELLKIKGISKKIKPDGAIIPISVRGKTAMRKNGKNVLLVGDAAGQVKATSGGGVVFGGNCAIIAGEHFDEPNKYESEWRGKFGFDLFLHSLVNNCLAGKNDEQLRRFGSRLRTSGLETYLSEHGSMDRPSRMISFGLARRLSGIVVGA